jgi:uncharacterized protein YcbK (DUF882 family)
MDSFSGKAAAGPRGRLLAIVSVAVVVLLHPSAPSASIDQRQLVFYHTHTGKRLDVVYARGDEYVESALDDVNRFLSDFRTGEEKRIDPELLDLLYDVRESLGSDGTFEVISAYRSPRTNEMLRRRTSGVARHSQHLLGKAIDVRLRGVPLEKLRDAALRMHRGGVGYYEQSDFVHLDTGRVRRW